MKQLLCAKSELRADGVYSSCEQNLNIVTPQNGLCVFALRCCLYRKFISTEIISNSPHRMNLNIKRQFSKFVEMD